VWWLRATLFKLSYQKPFVKEGTKEKLMKERNVNCERKIS